MYVPPGPLPVPSSFTLLFRRFHRCGVPLLVFTKTLAGLLSDLLIRKPQKENLCPFSSFF